MLPNFVTAGDGQDRDRQVPEHGGGPRHRDHQEHGLWPTGSAGGFVYISINLFTQMIVLINCKPESV